METNFSHNYVPQMVKLLVPLELNVQTFLNTHFHLHCSNGALLNLIIGFQYCKIDLFCEGRFHISSQSASDEISDSSCDTVESLVLLFEIGELELDGFAFGQYSGGLKFFRGWVELSAQVFIAVNF